MTCERSRSDRQDWVRLSEHYSHHYRYLVTQLIHMHIDILKFREVQDKLLPAEHILALEEEIAGFLLDQVINPEGEYYYPLPPP